MQPNIECYNFDVLKIQILFAAVTDKDLFYGHPNCENNASDLKNTENNENITQLLDFSYCWNRHNDLFQVIFCFFFILDSTWNICYIRDLIYPTEMKIIFWKSKDRSASTKRKLTSFLY